MPAVVADAGPLIHLDELGLWHTLEVFNEVQVPRPVADELTAAGPDLPGASIRPPAHIVTTGKPSVASRVPGLSMADRSVIELALAANIRTVLCDDLDLRNACTDQDLQPRGTIGIIVLAARRGHLTPDDIMAALDRVHADTTLYVSARVLDTARRTIRDLRDSN